MLAVSVGMETGGHAARRLLLLSLFGVLGVAAIIQPLAGIALVLAAYLALRGQAAFRDAVILLLLGNTVLTYGFANVGLNFGGLPVPLTELLLLPLVGWCLLSPNSLRSLGLPGVFLAAFVVVASLRLIFDFPQHGNDAIRDFTTPLEALALVVGFWAFNRYGLAWAFRIWKLVFVSVIFYALLFPWSEQLAAAGPMVGLQQPVPLLGQYSGSGPAVATAFFFCLLVFRPPVSVVLAAVALGCVALFQLRGLYLALPFATLLVFLASSRVENGFVAKMATSLVIGGLIFVLIMPLGLQGRLGPVTPSFVTEQIRTLIGREGTGDGSYEDRLGWLDRAWEDLTSKPSTLIFGLGLGPDLAGGFKSDDDSLVRKPHNDYMEVLPRLGVVGFAAWMAFLLSVLLPIWRGVASKHALPEERTFLLGVIVGAACYLLLAATQPLLAFPYGTVPLFIFLGMGLALARRSESVPAEVPLDRPVLRAPSPSLATTAAGFSKQP